MKYKAPFTLPFIMLLAMHPVSTYAQVLEVRPYAPELFAKGLSGAVCGFTADGQTIYFVREDAASHKLLLFEAARGSDGWAGEKLLPFSGEDSDMGGRLSPDGNTLYFTSDRPGGGSDPEDVWNIWQSSIQSGEWSPPIPLSAINDLGDQCCLTPISDGLWLFSNDDDDQQWTIFQQLGDDISEETSLNRDGAWQWPSYFAADEQILFFNSMKRPDSRGKDDIYITRLEEGLWSPPINLGDLVNTSAYEDGAILSPDRQLLIFNRHGAETPSRVMAILWEPLRRQLFE